MPRPSDPPSKKRGFCSAPRAGKNQRRDPSLGPIRIGCSIVVSRLSHLPSEKHGFYWIPQWRRHLRLIYMCERGAICPIEPKSVLNRRPGARFCPENTAIGPELASVLRNLYCTLSVRGYLRVLLGIFHSSLLGEESQLTC
jgi:hypothetical protein